MRTRNTETFGQFITRVSSGATEANQSVLASLKAKIEAEQAMKLERFILQARDAIDAQVGALRAVRAREQMHLAEIKLLEQKVNDALSGKIEL
jgi:BMFP domain-containing protein YqiC